MSSIKSSRLPAPYKKERRISDDEVERSSCDESGRERGRVGRRGESRLRWLGVKLVVKSGEEEELWCSAGKEDVEVGV